MRDTLDDLLIQSGLVTVAQLADAVAHVARTRKRLPETLIDLQLVDERRFARWMSEVSGTPLVDPIPDDATTMRHKVSPSVARELEVVPLYLINDELSVVMVNPLDASIVDILQATSGLKIRPMTGVRTEVERQVKHLYPEEDPFDFEYGTMMAGRAPVSDDHDTQPPLPPSRAIGDESTVPTNPFVAIDRRLDQMARMMKTMQKRLDDLEAMLAHVENR